MSKSEITSIAVTESDIPVVVINCINPRGEEDTFYVTAKRLINSLDKINDETIVLQASKTGKDEDNGAGGVKVPVRVLQ